MINFKQFIEKATADNSKPRLGHQVAKTTSAPETLISKDGAETTIVHLKHIQSTRKEPFAASNDDVHEDRADSDMGSSDTDEAIAPVVGPIRIRPNAEFLSRYVGSREKMNLKVDNATAQAVKEDVELTLFRRKGENVLRRIAKYYGFSIEIVGRDDVPEGYVAEISNNGSRIAAGNDGVIAALRGYWDEQHQLVTTTEQTDHDVKTIPKKAKLNKKKLAQQAKAATANIAEQPLIPAQTTSAPTKSNSSDVDVNNAIIPSDTTKKFRGSGVTSQFRITPRSKQQAGAGTPEESSSVPAGQSVMPNPDIKQSPSSHSVTQPALTKANESNQLLATKTTEIAKKTGMIRLPVQQSTTTVASDRVSNGPDSVLGKRAASTVSTSTSPPLKAVVEATTTDGTIKVNSTESSTIAGESVASLKSGHLNGQQQQSSSRKMLVAGGQQLARRAFMSIKAQV